MTIPQPNFPTAWPEIISRMRSIDPVAYARSRNYTTGSVTYLSPYLSRGVISTRRVLESLIERGLTFDDCEQLVKELAWRDHFQRVWQARDVSVNLRPTGPSFKRSGTIPSALIEASTGIASVDEAIHVLEQTGYMHNHCRMYVAAIACHAASCHWLEPARWMYYHLIDGDWASNACSWQWVAGTGSSKPWVADQQNINRFTGSQQWGTFLDVSYERLLSSPVPEALKQVVLPQLTTSLPDHPVPVIDPSKPVHVYNYYNLDPEWRRSEAANRILLLEPEVFKRYPVGQKAIGFLLDLAQQLPGLVMFTGSFSQLKQIADGAVICYREHPLNRHYSGEMDQREWLTPEVSGYFSSFSAYWKQIGPILRAQFESDKT
ncbi:MAG: FAD-binding domain-containing protein [Bacteroidota bacterium]